MIAKVRYGNTPLASQKTSQFDENIANVQVTMEQIIEARRLNDDIPF
jgi:hypothetical protein